MTYEVSNRSSERRRGNRAGTPKESRPEYAVVDRKKKEKKVRFSWSSSKRILPFDCDQISVKFVSSPNNQKHVSLFSVQCIIIDTHSRPRSAVKELLKNEI